MRPSPARLAITLVLGALMAVVAGAAPAAAATVTNCSAWQTKKFKLPGKPDHKVKMRNCVSRSGNYLRAETDWQETQAGTLSLGQKRFDMFVVGTRLERNNSDIVWNNCDLLTLMNNNRYNKGTCYTSWINTSLTGGWTGDGTVSYDIDNDGEDGFAWGLTGSPALA